MRRKFATKGRAELSNSQHAFRIRTGQKGDGRQGLELFRRAVLTGSAEFYSDAQRQAWANAPNPQTWEDRMLSGQCLVAATPSDQILGFFTMGADGYLDYAYVEPAWMGQGIASALYDQIEAWAIAEGLTVLSTEASHLARRFLIKKNWCLVAQQHAIREGIAIPNFRMTKHI